MLSHLQEYIIQNASLIIFLSIDSRLFSTENQCRSISHASKHDTGVFVIFWFTEVTTVFTFSLQKTILCRSFLYWQSTLSKLFAIKSYSQKARSPGNQIISTNSWLEKFIAKWGFMFTNTTNFYQTSFCY